MNDNKLKMMATQYWLDSIALIGTGFDEDFKEITSIPDLFDRLNERLQWYSSKAINEAPEWDDIRELFYKEDFSTHDKIWFTQYLKEEVITAYLKEFYYYHNQR